MFPLLLFVQKWNYSEIDLKEINLYDVISVERGTSVRDIRKIYNRYQKQRKSTVNPSQRQLKIWKQQEFAFSTLALDHQRAIYDQLGSDALCITDFNAIGYQSPEGFEMMKQMLGKVPEEFVNYGGVLVFPVEFTLKEFMTGAKRRISVDHIVQCQKCKDKVKDEQKSIDIKLPKGAPNFFRTIGKGIGDALELRGAADVIFVCTQRPDSAFERNGRDLITTVNVTIVEALSNEPVTIVEPDGTEVKVNVTNAQNGEMRRVEGYGLPDPINKKEKGDLIVKINLVFPQLDDKMKALIKENL